MVIPALWLTFLCLLAEGRQIYEHTRTSDMSGPRNEVPEPADLKTLAALHFPSTYHAKGKVLLPSADLVEPFEVWYSSTNKRSRLDFYDGAVKTFFRADKGKYGTLYEIVPKFDFRHQKHYEGCWMKKGRKDKKVVPQGVIPRRVFWPFKMNLTEFKFHGFTTIDNKECTKWIANVTKYERTNTYVFYTSNEKVPKPIRYEMFGYDVVLTSYYDNYTFEYTLFEKWNYNASVFDLPKVAKRDRWCWNISKTLGDAGERNLNPVGELLDPDLSDDLNREFNLFKLKHAKTNREEIEDRKRQHIFRNSLRYIQSMNRRNLGYRLGLNHFADMTNEEYESHSGLSYDLNDMDYPGEILEYFEDEGDPIFQSETGTKYHTTETSPYGNFIQNQLLGKQGEEVPYDIVNDDPEDTTVENTVHAVSKTDHAKSKNKQRMQWRKKHKQSKQESKKKEKIAKSKLPNELDWRAYGAVSPVRSQAVCGSCWSFSVTAAVESSHFLKTGKMLRLSEQMLIDCTWYIPNAKGGNNGCLGGWTWKALAFVKQFGLATEKTYGKYLGMEGKCKEYNVTTIPIDSYMKVKPHDAQALMKALHRYGPVTASINTSPKTLKFYKSGVYDDKKCTSASDHSVLVVGYGRKRGKLYWIVKNSWSEHWGDKGYIMIRNGHCGILNRPWAVITRNRKIFPKERNS